MGIFHKNISLMLEFLKAPFWVQRFSYYTLMTFLKMLFVIFDDTSLYSKCDQASHLWQQLELVPELESDLQNTVDWGKKWLVDFSGGKFSLFCLSGLIMLVPLM